MRHFWALIIISIISLMLSINSQCICAHKNNEYFEYNYKGEFSNKSIRENELFQVKVISQGICKISMPIKISEVHITCQIIAKHRIDGNHVALNDQVNVIIDGLPNVEGEPFRVESNVYLIFPKNSTTGLYDVILKTTKVKFQVFDIWSDGKQYMPIDSFSIGTIELT